MWICRGVADGGGAAGVGDEMRSDAARRLSLLLMTTLLALRMPQFGIAAGLAGFVVVIVIVVIVNVVCYLRKQRARPELPAGAVELSSTVDAPISLHSVSAIPMDMRPNDAALAAAAAER